MHAMRRAWLPLLCCALQLVSVDTGHGSAPTGWAGALFTLAAFAAGLALLARDREPLVVLLLCSGLYAVQVVSGGPALPAALTVMVFLVARGRTAQAPRASVAAVLLSLLVMAAALVLARHPYQAAPFGLVVTGAAALGLLSAARAAREESRRVDLLGEQRLRIARDLHDIVGHGLGAITMQAGAARLAVAGGASADATRSLLEIESAGRGMLREVRWLVGLMREESGTPALSGVDDLVANARRSGLEVNFAAEGALARVPAHVGEAAYRIVQESLTNVVRHAHDSRVDVRLVVDDRVLVHVSDTGTAGTGAEEGNGVKGMRERAAAVGGSLLAGPEEGGGWTVRAALPLSARG
jgi:signal transduction histidine kinase